jgi:large subunit ribosomal protein L4
LNVAMSARNLQEVLYQNSANINTFDIMKAQQLLIVESSIKDINEMFNN